MAVPFPEKEAMSDIFSQGCACAMAVPFRRYAVRIVSPE